MKTFPVAIINTEIYGSFIIREALVVVMERKEDFLHGLFVVNH